MDRVSSGMTGKRDRLGGVGVGEGGTSADLTKARNSRETALKRTFSDSRAP